jgi:hypothetical protein
MLRLEQFEFSKDTIYINTIQIIRSSDGTIYVLFRFAQHLFLISLCLEIHEGQSNSADKIKKRECALNEGASSYKE